MTSPDPIDERSTSARLRDVEAERDRLRAFVLALSQMDDAGFPLFARQIHTSRDLALAAREVLA